MLTVSKMPIDCDLCHHTMVEACSMLGSAPCEDMTLVCSFEEMREGLGLSRKYGMRLITLPKEILNGPDVWCVGWAESWVWSNGASFQYDKAVNERAKTDV